MIARLKILSRVIFRCFILFRDDSTGERNREPGGELYLFRARNLLRSHLPNSALHVLLNLLRLGGADDDCAYPGVRKQPSNSQFAHLVPAFFGKGFEFGELFPVRIGEESFIQGVVGLRGIPSLGDGGGGPSFRYLPVRKPPARGPQGMMPSPCAWQQGTISCSTCRSKRFVLRLHRHERVQMVHPGCPLGFGDLPGGEIGAADIAHLSGFHQVIQGTKRFFNGGCRVRKMILVEVKVVGVEPSQTGFYRSDKVPARAAPLIGRIPMAKENLLATKTCVRFPFRTRPRNSSDLPLSYISAVSMKLMPLSMARWMTAADADSSMYQPTCFLRAPERKL